MKSGQLWEENPPVWFGDCLPGNAGKACHVEPEIQSLRPGVEKAIGVMDAKKRFALLSREADKYDDEFVEHGVDYLRIVK